jgi:type IV secretory pathway TrbF-like protein
VRGYDSSVTGIIDSQAQPWSTRVWSAMKRRADWLIIGVTLLVIAAGILGLILLPGQLGSWNH